MPVSAANQQGGIEICFIPSVLLQLTHFYSSFFHLLIFFFLALVLAAFFKCLVANYCICL